MDQDTAAVNATYGSIHLTDRLLAELQAAGHDTGRLCADDLRAFDELHLMGREATVQLGQLAALAPGMRVLDMGSGLGGPARTLAREFGCHVTGIDLSREFVMAATALSERVGLGQQVAFHHGNALHLPFADRQYDAVFMIHLGMNIADKHTLFSEARRVLKKGAKLLLWEICKGDAPGFVFPVPWARDPSFSYLVGTAELIALVKSCGFGSLQVQDATDQAVAWVRARQSAAKHKPKERSRLNLDLVLDDFRLKRANISRNLIQGCIRILRAAATRVGNQVHK